MKVYVIYDAKVEAYLQPFFAPTAGSALRSWEDLVNDGKSQMSRWPDHFAIFEAAEFDESTGRFEQYDTLKPLGTALEFKKSA